MGCETTEPITKRPVEKVFPMSCETCAVPESCFSTGRCVMEPGSWILLSSEQSNKTAAIAAICTAAYVARKPCIVAVKDGYSNVQGMADKLRKLLRTHRSTIAGREEAVRGGKG